MNRNWRSDPSNLILNIHYNIKYPSYCWTRNLFSVIRNVCLPHRHPQPHQPSLCTTTTSPPPTTAMHERYSNPSPLQLDGAKTVLCSATIAHQRPEPWTGKSDGPRRHRWNVRSDGFEGERVVGVGGFLRRVGSFWQTISMNSLIYEWLIDCILSIVLYINQRWRAFMFLITIYNGDNQHWINIDER